MTPAGGGTGGVGPLWRNGATRTTFASNRGVVMEGFLIRAVVVGIGLWLASQDRARRGVSVDPRR